MKKCSTYGNTRCTKTEKYCTFGDCDECQKNCWHDNLIDDELIEYGRAICRDCLKEIPKKYLTDEELKKLKESK